MRADLPRRIGIGINTSTAFTVFHESKRLWPFNRILNYIPYLTKAVSLRMQHIQYLNELLDKRRNAKDTEPDLYVPTATPLVQYSKAKCDTA